MSLYRVACGPLERRRAELTKAVGDLAARAPELHAIRSRRLARVVAGAIGVFGAAGLPLVLIVEQDATPIATYWLFGAVLAALASYALARASLAFAGPGALATARVSGRDLASLEASNPWPRLAGSLARMEAWGLALPLVAASLLGPLTIHGAVFAVLSAADAAPFAASFAKWILLSSVIVGHAHVALAVCTGRYAIRLARARTEELVSDAPRREWLHALLVVAGVSALPGIVLLGIPPVLTLLTGLVLVPILYALARRAAASERAVLDGVEDEVAHVRVGIDDIEAAREQLAAEPAPAARVLSAHG